MKVNKKNLIVAALLAILIMLIAVCCTSPESLNGRSILSWGRQAEDEQTEITVSGLPDNKIIRGPIEITITVTPFDQTKSVIVKHADVEDTLQMVNNSAVYSISENGQYQIEVKDAQGALVKGKQISITQIDNKEPSTTKPELTATVNSVTATFKQEDNLGSANSGLTEERKYRLTNAEGTTGEWVTVTDNQYTFTGLEDGMVYYVQTMATDKVEFASLSEVALIMTPFQDINEIISVTRTPADTVTWTKKVVFNIDVIGGDRYSIKTSIDGTSFVETNRQIIEENDKTLYGKIICNGVESEVYELDQVHNVDVYPPTDTAPTGQSTANTITATFNQTDDKSGINESKTRYRLLGDSEGQEVVAPWQTSNVFTGLISEKDYYLQSLAEDILGNSQESALTKVTTKAVTDGSSARIEYNSAWTNQDVVVTVTNPSNEFTLEISRDGNRWNETSPLTFTENGTIYTRFTDGTNYGRVGTKQITNIDKIAPTDAAPTVAATVTTLSITNNQTDNEGGSGLQSKETRFCTTLEGTESLAGYDWSNTEVYRNLIPDTTYYVQTRYTDKAGNVTLSQVREAKTNNIPITEGKISVEATDIGDIHGEWTTKVKVRIEITDPTAIAIYTLEISTDGINYSALSAQEIELEENKPIYTRFTDGTYTGPGNLSYTVDNIDTFAPTTTAPTGETTEERITITKNQVDNECGIDESKTKYRLLLDEEGTEIAKNWQASNVFTGLTANKTYYMQTYAEDYFGNGSESETTEIKTWLVPSIDNLTLIATPSGDWTGGDVTVRANNSKNAFAVQMSLDGTNYETTNEVVVENNNTTVYARYINGDLPGSDKTSIKIENIDKIAPTEAAPQILEVTTRKIVAASEQTDTQSGIKKVEYRALEEITDETPDDEGWQTEGTFDELKQTTTYYIQTRAEDNVGNVSLSTPAEVITETVPKATSENVRHELNPSDWTNEDVTVTVTPLIEGYDIELAAKNQEFQRTRQITVSEDGFIRIRYTDGVNAGEYDSTLTIMNIDKDPPSTNKPTVTTTKTSISANIEQTDGPNAMGVSGLNEETIRYRLVTDETGEEALEGYDWQESGLFENLRSDETYYVQTKVTDNAGNESISEVTTCITDPIPDANVYVTYEKTPKEWTNEEVIITLDNSQAAFQMEYSTDRENYMPVENNEIRVEENVTLYIRLTNGISQGKELTIIVNNIDKTSPLINAQIVRVTDTAIYANASAQDSESGVKEIKYRLVKSMQGTVPVENRDWQESGEFLDLTPEKTYYVQFKAIDKAGNETTTIIKTQTSSSKTEVTSEDYTVLEDDQIITRVPVGTTLEEFESKIEVNRNYQIVDEANNPVTDGIMKTGYRLTTDTADYEIAVIGDISGNGRLDAIDISRLRAHLVEYEGKILTGARFHAADVSGDGKTSIIDLTRLRKMIVDL